MQYGYDHFAAKKPAATDPVRESAAGLLESFLCLVFYVFSTSRSHFTGPPFPLEKKR